MFFKQKSFTNNPIRSIMRSFSLLALVLALWCDCFPGVDLGPLVAPNCSRLFLGAPFCLGLGLGACFAPCLGLGAHFCSGLNLGAPLPCHSLGAPSQCKSAGLALRFLQWHPEWLAVDLTFDMNSTTCSLFTLTILSKLMFVWDNWLALYPDYKGLCQELRPCQTRRLWLQLWLDQRVCQCWRIGRHARPPQL